LGLAAPAAKAQQSDQEIVANLAAGRVLLCVTRDSIIIGASADNVEPGSHAPMIVPMDAAHIAVVLGAAEWVEPGSGKPPVRLDEIVSHLRGVAGHAMPITEANEAGDIEAVGIAFLEKIRPIVARMHHPLNLKPEEPLVELILVDYEKDYGPEAWLLSYTVRQRELENDYWDTLVMRPSFTQLYPPEKKQPKTVVEVSYPADPAGPTIADLLGQNDQRLASVRSSDPKVAQAAQQMLDGEANKAASDPATAFLRGALQATSAPDAKLALAVLHENDRFDWVIASPEPLPKINDTKRDADAPTLRKPHGD
ncbi:MAG: hypothetical protein ACRD5L_09540, partial [Bryobacteraceae bacterium]